MAGRICSETKYAIELHKTHGKSITEACRIAGIYRSTLYKALKRKAEKKMQK